MQFLEELSKNMGLSSANARNHLSPDYVILESLNYTQKKFHHFLSHRLDTVSNLPSGSKSGHLFISAFFTFSCLLFAVFMTFPSISTQKTEHKVVSH